MCLSILGTWQGESGEKWSSAQGLESVLLSIQSLLSSNPIENEPGYERVKADDPESKAYVAKIRHETLRISIVERLETLLNAQRGELESCFTESMPGSDLDTSECPQRRPSAEELNSGVPSAFEYDAEATFNSLDSTYWDPFTDLMKQRFMWYYDSYLHSIESNSVEQKDHDKFVNLDFESAGNGMSGQFDYQMLRKRLERIMDRLEEERSSWVQRGVSLLKNGSHVANRLNYAYPQMKHKWNESQNSGAHMEVDLADPANPFVWTLTFFGKPSYLGDTPHSLDDGVFVMRMFIPPDFPESQPRVIFETTIYHHRVTSRQFLCYVPKKPDEISSHLEAIFDTITDKDITYDPRTRVNIEPFELYWGGPEKRKIYDRKQRRSAQDSLD